MVVSFFVLLGVETHNYHKEVVNFYCAESPSNLTETQVNDAITAMLELELERIQQGLTILTIWAGVMMIVFLVFSLYSMHRSDELEKEGQEALVRMQDATNKMNTDASKNLKDLDQKIQDETNKLYEELSLHSKEFDELTSEKQRSFESVYHKYKDDLDKATKEFHAITKNMVQLMKKLLESGEEEGENNDLK